MLMLPPVYVMLKMHMAKFVLRLLVSLEVGKNYNT